MSTASATVAYSGRAAADSLPALRLTLEPERVGERANRATLADIDAMLALAASGASARNRQASRCGWAKWEPNGDLVVSLALRVWPSDLDLRYSLTLPRNVTSAPRVLERLPRNKKYWVAGSGGELELPWLLEDAVFSWHPRIGVWDADCRPADEPEITQNKARLILAGDGERYGVLHARGTAAGWRHDISIRYPKGSGPDAPAISITAADDVDVRATWTDERGEERSETARIEIPDCVRDMLAECPAGSRRRVVMRSDRPERVVVYYNGCTGRLLDIRREEA